MFGLGLPELIVILVILIVIFGVGKLADIGPAVGKAIKGFRKGLSDEEPPPSEKDKEDR